MKIEISKLHQMARSMSFSDFTDWLKHKITKTPITVHVHGEVLADVKISYGDTEKGTNESVCQKCLSSELIWWNDDDCICDNCGHLQTDL